MKKLLRILKDLASKNTEARKQRNPTQTTKGGTSKACNPQKDSSLNIKPCFSEIVGHVEIFDTRVLIVGMTLEMNTKVIVDQIEMILEAI